MKLSTRTRATTLSVTLAATLALSACGASNETEGAAGGAGDGEAGASGELSGTLVGAGSSAQQAAMQAWTAEYTSLQPDVTVNYDPVGSGGGREQFVSGGTDFAGTDAYLDEEELAAAQERCAGDGEIVELVNYIAPIGIVYNLEGVEELNLPPEVLAGIFNQDITNWNDPAIAEANPDATLPDLPITVVNRSDESGTTENFAEYLSAVAPDIWDYEVSGDWPVSGGEAAQGTSGVVSAVRAGEGTIGYADPSQAGDLGLANVGVGGEFVGPTPEAAAAVVDNSERVEGRGEYSFALDIRRDTEESGNYPIVQVSYLVGCLTYDDQEVADLVTDFMSYVVSEEGQQAAAEAAGSAPISDELREQSVSAIEAITAE